MVEKRKDEEAKAAEIKATKTTPMPTVHPKTIVNSRTPQGSSTVLTYANQVPVQSVSVSQHPPFVETIEKSTTIPSVIPTSAQIPSATENHLLPTQEQILREIKVTLEERKKLCTFVTKYEKGLHDLQNGNMLPNVRMSLSVFRLKE